MSLTKVSFSMIDGAVVNVLDYGAKGDNSTDDAAAIQAAVNAGATIYIPNGKYKIKTPINVPIYKRIIGQNILDTQIIADASIDAVIKVGTLNGTNPLKLNALENFAVYGSNLADTGIVFNTQDSLISNVYVEGTKVHAIHAQRAWSNTFFKVKCSYNFANAIYLDTECNNFDVISCEIDNNDGTGIVVEESLVVSIYGCGVESNGKNGVLLQGIQNSAKYNPPFVPTPAAKINVSDCYFENNGRLQSGSEIVADVKLVHGINPTDAVTHVTVRDCNFNGNNYPNLWVVWLDFDSTHFTWEDNRATGYTPTLGKAFIGYQGDRAFPSYINFKNDGLGGFVKSDAFASKFSVQTYASNGNVQFNGLSLTKQQNAWVEEGDFEYDSSTKRLNITTATGTNPVQYNLQGTTAQRPGTRYTSQMYFDTTLGIPIWWDGSNWKDATGATV